jgi:hypothetical protein
MSQKWTLYPFIFGIFIIFIIEKNVTKNKGVHNVPNRLIHHIDSLVYGIPF